MTLLTDLARDAPTRHVPVPGAIVRRALDLLHRDTGAGPDLAQLVELDATLSGAVMRVLRCPIYGQAGSGLDVRAALEGIGRPVLERVLGGLPMPASPRSREQVEAACQSWIRAVAVAAAARWLSNQGLYEEPDEAYLAGLVHDLGSRGAGSREEDRLRARQAEAQVREWRLGHRVAAVARFLPWVMAGGRPEDVHREGLPLDEPTRRLLAVVARGASMVAALGFGSGTAPAEEPAPGAARGDDLDAPAVEEAVMLELAHAGHVLGLASGDPAELAHRLAEQEARLGECAWTPSRHVPPQRTALRLAEVHRQLVQTRDLVSVHDVMVRGLRLLHQGLGFDRLLLFEREPGRGEVFRSRLVLCPTELDFSRGAGGEVLHAGRESVLVRALDTDTAFRGDDPRCDAAVLDALGVASFAVAPMRAGAASRGVVVVDHFFSGRPVTDSDSALLGIVCASLGLVMERVALDTQGRKLRALAEKDALTGINNRRNVLELLQREIDRARRYGKPLSVAMVDVDHFKSWNDLHGHQVGDMVLQSVAQLITSCSREIDCYGRYGGEEFLIVLPETPVDHAVLYAERLRATIEERGRDLRQAYPDSQLSISVGVTNLAPRGDDMDRIIQRADAALYAAKRHGRNRVCVEPGGGSTTPAPPPPAIRGILDDLL